MINKPKLPFEIVIDVLNPCVCRETVRNLPFYIKEFTPAGILVLDFFADTSREEKLKLIEDMFLNTKYMNAFLNVEYLKDGSALLKGVIHN